MSLHYVDWLQAMGVPIYTAGGATWRVVHHCLVPASSRPCFPQLSGRDIRELFRRSGAWMIRYSSEPAVSNAWWWNVCDHHDPRRWSGSTRREVARGTRLCSARPVDPSWLATHGYRCYRSAYRRYRGARPLTPERFRQDVMTCARGPFAYWGVFVGNDLAGLCQCLLEDKYVGLSQVKLAPEYLRFRTSYSLVVSLIEHYVVQKGLILHNGNPAVLHDTRFQEFLGRLGFSKRYCRLNVHYRDWLKVAVGALFPLRGLVRPLARALPLHPLAALLTQEELRRLSTVASAPEARETREAGSI